MNTAHIKILCLFFLFAFLSNNATAQKYMTKTGHAYFISHTDAIDIDGNNHQVAAIADVETGDIVVIVLVKAFEFTLATADKHFNETYMESDKYPKATFKGKVSELKTVDLKKDGVYDVVARGGLTIHGQTNTVETPGKLSVNNGNLTITCGFSVLIDDYKIEVPKSVEGRVAKKVDIKISMELTLKI
jgi:polyisoprenoid-binding protein YceI